jgi:ABC-type Zn uptake system ZnuABC Zn-binding protein ZnuA
MRRIFLTLFLTLMTTSSVFAGLNVVATLPWVGSLAKEIGKDKINVTTLIKPSHARPISSCTTASTLR